MPLQHGLAPREACTSSAFWHPSPVNTCEARFSLLMGRGSKMLMYAHHNLQKPRLCCCVNGNDNQTYYEAASENSVFV